MQPLQDIMEDRQYEVREYEGSRFEMSNKLKGILIILGGILLVVGVIIFAVSWETLEPLEYGLVYNKITGTVNTEDVYESGRYIIGPAHTFIRFPRAWTTLEFSNRDGAPESPIVTRTRDGVPITVSFSFQYQIKRENVSQLYNKYGTNYEAPITRVARNYILQAASNYEALAYWRNRTQVEVEMFDFIQTNVGQNMHVEIKMIQLLKIELPQKFEDSIINSQVQQQQMQTQEYMQQTTKILLKIKQLYAEAQYNCTLIGSSADATAIGLQNQAQSTAFQFTQDTQATAIKQFSDKLGMKSTELLEYLKIRNIRNKQNGKTLKVGLSYN
jgi:regulator of protease activity HflC (stomatin/prohibitin superfamily)